MSVRLVLLSSNMQWFHRLTSEGVDLKSFSHCDRFIQELAADSVDAAVIQLPVDPRILARIASAWSETRSRKPVVLFDPAGTVPNGSFPSEAHIDWFLLKSDDLHEVRRTLASLAAPPAAAESWRSMIVGVSPAIAEVRELVGLVGKSNATVLITGNTGTGKEVIARALHQASARANGPFVAINCAALPASLLESELFGHAKGAFTGASSARIGLFERANGGTILLDEIGEMPVDLQAKLLRVLQQREILPLGTTDPTPINVRVLAATNANLRSLCQSGAFRSDLYYRLNVVPLRLPDLGDRPEDIVPLANHFLSLLAAADGTSPKELSTEACEVLSRYPWPGNVRELEHAVERAVVISANRRFLNPADFVLDPIHDAAPAAAVLPQMEIPDSGFNLNRAVHEFEMALIDMAMRKAGGNKQRAANLLGMKRTSMIYKHKALEQFA